MIFNTQSLVFYPVSLDLKTAARPFFPPAYNWKKRTGDCNGAVEKPLADSGICRLLC